MNKEKIINKLEYISNNPLINGEYDEENYLFDDEAKLILNHINNLQSKIDKAIEYIKETIKENYEWDMYRENKLLDILKEDK